MIYKNFGELILKAQGLKKIMRLAVVAAHDEHTLEAVFKARNDKILEPILIGHREKILDMIEKLGESIDSQDIIHITDHGEAATEAVRLVREGKADFIMKGNLQTADLLRAVVNKEKGLKTGRIMSVLMLHEVPNYHKLLAITDGGMTLYPNLEEKKQIIENAVEAYQALGYDNPKVAILAAVENVNPKMPESIDAGKLKEMNQSGEIAGCIVEGPISYDLTMSKESAEIKGYESPVTGDADILIAPNITTGNILSKALAYSAGAKLAGYIVGAKVPIVLTSRGASSEEKYLSLALAACATK
jgi:phosphate butyryltransferase